MVKSNLKDRKSEEVKLNNLVLLSEFLDYKDNWNGYGASKFEKKLIDKVCSIVDSLETQPFVILTRRSTVQLEYETEEK